MQSKCQWLPPNRITTRAPFKDLFPIEQGTVDAVADHMKANGYDESQPIIVWKESHDKHPVIIDGHTRLLAALKIMLSPVYVAVTDFPDEQAAIEYAIHNQRDRRNLTDTDLIRCVQAVDKRKPRGGDRKSGAVKSKASSDAIDVDKAGKSKSAIQPFDSAQETAKIVGTSRDKVKKARTILDHADEDTRQAVLDGKKSIHAAAKETQNKREPKVKEPSSEKPLQEISRLTEVMGALDDDLGDFMPHIMRYCRKPLANKENAYKVRTFFSQVYYLRDTLIDIFTAEMNARETATKEKQKKPIEPEEETLSVPEIAGKNFDEKVIKSDLPVLVDFYTAGCQPCRQLLPKIESIAEDYKGKMYVYKCDDKDICKKYGVRGAYSGSVPQLIVFHNGKHYRLDQMARTKQEIKREVSKALRS